jgi:hypothetical protein
MIKRLFNMAKYIAKRTFSYFHPEKAQTIEVKQGGNVDIPEGDEAAYLAEGKVEKVRETAAKAEPKVESKSTAPAKVSKATTKQVTKKAAPNKQSKK